MQKSWKKIALFSAWVLVTFAPLAKADVVAMTILAEARGEGEVGMRAVACVIAQRAQERRQTPRQVCLARFQFSCWNNKGPEDLQHLMRLPQASYAKRLSRDLARLDRSLVGEANHYHATWMRKKPYWAKGRQPTKVIGRHAFYRL